MWLSEVGVVSFSERMISVIQKWDQNGWRKPLEVFFGYIKGESSQRGAITSKKPLEVIK